MLGTKRVVLSVQIQVLFLIILKVECSVVLVIDLLV